MTANAPAILRVGLIVLAVTLALPAGAQVSGRTGASDRDIDAQSDPMTDPAMQQPLRTTSPTTTMRPGATARSSIGQVGQRQQREQELSGIGAGLRIQNRIQNRIQSRLSLRIDRNYDPGASQRAPFAVANDQVRSPTARIGRRLDSKASH
ncbi:hypothetical protein [Sphingomonas aquatilis]|jgi:hypothetical protein|uniref:hypothetical protein n=1 Tax=Sphingomonas aquatilis TaxID=93063 RepID=UPI0023F668C1|nr:hypothetical protein [Sphingomonas aquatilis]MCI4655874.1 hypothetical protein [Sphingomonas aquatilis]